MNKTNILIPLSDQLEKEALNGYLSLGQKFLENSNLKLHIKVCEIDQNEYQSK